MSTHFHPKSLRRVGMGFAVLLLLLAVALFLGFHVGTGCAWALHAVWALAGAAGLTGLGLAGFAAHARARASHHDAKVAERLDRVFQHVNATDA
ncbi:MULTISPECIES: hypothetical protein [unclassified Variovorax]|uniref:hypothetical protein n=1 Tax=unclassified Variovorax TaxID=663243 RepID=UPI0032E6DE11